MYRMIKIGQPGHFMGLVSTMLAIAIVLASTIAISADDADGEDYTTYTIDSGYTLQGIYSLNKDAMDNADEWKFDKESIYVGTSDIKDEAFAVPVTVKKITGYGTTDEGTELKAYYYYGYPSQNIVFQAGSNIVVDNIYFSNGADGSVDITVEDGADVTFENCYFMNAIRLSDGAKVKFANSVIAGAIEINSAYTVLENVTFESPRYDLSLTIDSNIIKPNAKVGENFEYVIAYPNSITDGTRTIELKGVELTSKIDGIDANASTGADGTKVTLEGTPSAAMENGIISADLTYNNDSNQGFRVAIPYYLSVDEADPVVDASTEDNTVIGEQDEKIASVDGAENKSEAAGITSNTDSPKTADGSMLGLWLGLMLVSLVGVAAAMRRRLN